MREASMIYEFLRYPPARSQKKEDAWWESCADLLLHVDNQFCSSTNLIILLLAPAPGPDPGSPRCYRLHSGQHSASGNNVQCPS